MTRVVSFFKGSSRKNRNLYNLFGTALPMAIEFSHILTLLYFVVPLLLTGVISGFLAGLLGVGGGIVIVPILAYLLEVSGIHTTTPYVHVAVGTSLAIIVPTSIISARSHFRLGNVIFNLSNSLARLYLLVLLAAPS